MKNTSLALAFLTGAISGVSHASVTGLVASVRQVSGYTMVDVYAASTSATDWIGSARLNTLATSASGGFVQSSETALKGWAPDSSGSSTMDSIDSFMTIGGTDLGDPSGPNYANTTLSATTTGCPPGTWVGTSLSAQSNQLDIPTGYALGWATSNGDPLGVVKPIADIPGRINILGDTSASIYGAWIMHLVIAGNDPCTISFGNLKLTGKRNGQYAFVYPNSSSPGAEATFTVPAPGPAAVLALAGLTRRRRA